MQFKTDDLIGFPLLDSIHLNHVFQSKLFLVHKAQPAKTDKRPWGRECELHLSWVSSADVKNDKIDLKLVL